MSVNELKAKRARIMAEIISLDRFIERELSAHDMTIEDAQIMRVSCAGVRSAPDFLPVDCDSAMDLCTAKERAEAIAALDLPSFNTSTHK